jgi:hypothetical protein
MSLSRIAKKLTQLLCDEGDVRPSSVKIEESANQSPIDWYIRIRF